jgi:hypothetical protein
MQVADVINLEGIDFLLLSRYDFFPSPPHRFMMHVTGWVEIEMDGEYEFCTNSSDGSKVSLFRRLHLVLRFGCSVMECVRMWWNAHV